MPPGGGWGWRRSQLTDAGVAGVDALAGRRALKLLESAAGRSASGRARHAWWTSRS